jgi:hypothetical protein
MTTLLVLAMHGVPPRALPPAEVRVHGPARPPAVIDIRPYEVK